LQAISQSVIRFRALSISISLFLEVYRVDPFIDKFNRIWNYSFRAGVAQG
jgi:hypothetical protein